MYAFVDSGGGDYYDATVALAVLFCLAVVIIVILLVAAETTRWKQFVLSSLLFVLSFQRMPTESSPTIYC